MSNKQDENGALGLSVYLDANGPLLPLALLKAQENERLVFFCGAGVSAAAGLPLFGGLVKEIYRLLGTRMLNDERDVFNLKQYEQALELLSLRPDVGRADLVYAARTALTDPKAYHGEWGLKTHRALLDLSRNRHGGIRLITTNYDHCFEKLKSAELTFDIVNALNEPRKLKRWLREKRCGLLYLHGFFGPDSAEEGKAEPDILLTGGDYGRYYVLGRLGAWLAELSKRFDICFVGYSANDLVIRYLLQALRSRRDTGEHGSTGKLWAFDCYESDNQITDKVRYWQTLGVTPLLYRLDTCEEDNDCLNGHGALHRTLCDWAKIATIMKDDPLAPYLDLARDDGGNYVSRPPKVGKEWVLSFLGINSSDGLIALANRGLNGINLRHFRNVIEEFEDQISELLKRDDIEDLSGCMRRIQLENPAGAALYAQLRRREEINSALQIPRHLKVAAARVLAEAFTDPRFVLWAVKNPCFCLGKELRSMLCDRLIKSETSFKKLPRRLFALLKFAVKGLVIPCRSDESLDDITSKFCETAHKSSIMPWSKKARFFNQMIRPEICLLEHSENGTDNFRALGVVKIASGAIGIGPFGMWQQQRDWPLLIVRHTAALEECLKQALLMVRTLGQLNQDADEGGVEIRLITAARPKVFDNYGQTWLYLVEWNLLANEIMQHLCPLRAVKQVKRWLGSTDPVFRRMGLGCFLESELPDEEWIAALQWEDFILLKSEVAKFELEALICKRAPKLSKSQLTALESVLLSNFRGATQRPKKKESADERTKAGYWLLLLKACSVSLTDNFQTAAEQIGREWSALEDMADPQKILWEYARLSGNSELMNKLLAQAGRSNSPLLVAGQWDPLAWRDMHSADTDDKSSKQDKYTDQICAVLRGDAPAESLMSDEYKLSTVIVKLTAIVSKLCDEGTLSSDLDTATALKVAELIAKLSLKRAKECSVKGGDSGDGSGAAYYARTVPLVLALRSEILCTGVIKGLGRDDQCELVKDEIRQQLDLGADNTQLWQELGRYLRCLLLVDEGWIYNLLSGSVRKLGSKSAAINSLTYGLLESFSSDQNFWNDVVFRLPGDEKSLTMDSKIGRLINYLLCAYKRPLDYHKLFPGTPRSLREDRHAKLLTLCILSFIKTLAAGKNTTAKGGYGCFYQELYRSSFASFNAGGVAQSLYFAGRRLRLEPPAQRSDFFNKVIMPFIMNLLPEVFPQGDDIDRSLISAAAVMLCLNSGEAVQEAYCMLRRRITTISYLQWMIDDCWREILADLRQLTAEARITSQDGIVYLQILSRFLPKRELLKRAGGGQSISDFVAQIVRQVPELEHSTVYLKLRDQILL